MKYFRILIDIYKSMAASTILQNTNFNIKLTNEKGFKGYIWCPEINMSVQGQNAIGTMKEIIKRIYKIFSESRPKLYDVSLFVSTQSEYPLYLNKYNSTRS